MASDNGHTEIADMLSAHASTEAIAPDKVSGPLTSVHPLL